MDESYPLAVALKSLSLHNNGPNAITEKNLIKINFVINEKLSDELNATSFAHHFPKENSVRITFRSIAENSENKIFWKLKSTKDEDNHHEQKFHLLNIEDDPDGAVTEYCQNHIDRAMIKGLSGISQDCEKNETINLRDLEDAKGRDLLINLIVQQNCELVEKFLNHNFDVNEEIESDNENFIYIDLPWRIFTKTENSKIKNTCNNMILSLLQADSKFPNEFKYEISSTEVQKFVTARRNLHALIKQKEAFKNETTKKLSYYFDDNNQSLLYNAIISGIDTKSFWDYREKFGLKLSSCEEKIESIAQFLKKAQQEKQKSAKELPGSHLSILNSVSKISDTNHPNENYRKYIEDAFIIINKNPGCSKALMVAAACKNLQIIFDFNYNTTHYLDPLTSEHAKGKISSDGVIKIGSKGLLPGEKNKFEVLATLIHELCHFAILMTYMNKFNPYKIGESDEKIKFKDKVYKECKKNIKKPEKIIQLVFDNYPDNYHDLELIVRPYHIMMHYYENPKIINDCMAKYPNLFEYLKEVVEPEFDNTLPVLKMIQSSDQEVTYNDLTEPIKTKILHTKIDFQCQKITIGEIIENDQDILQHLTSDVIKNILVNKNDFKLGDVWRINAKYEYVERKFVNFERDFKEKIFSHDELVFIAKESKFLILTGKAGDGKTRTFEELTKILKNISKNFWVSYIKLRNCRDIFEKRMSEKNISIEFLIELFCEIVCKTNSKFETEIFKKLFLNGKVILFLDGVDEICPKFNTFICEIVKVLKNETEIQVWVSTRPHHVTQLEKIAEINAFTFEPYGIIEATKLMRKILNSQNDKIIERLFEFFNKIVKFENPLFIIMVTELFVKKEIDLNSELKNIYEVYKKLIDEQVLRKEKEIGTEDRPFLGDFLQMLKVLALKFMFEPDQIKDFSIIKNWKSEKTKWTAEKIQRFGLVIVELNFLETDNKNSIDFIHYSYAEFFVTQFIFDYIFDEEKSDKIISHIFKMIKSLEYKWDSNSMLIGNLKSENKFSSKELHAKMKDLVVKEIDDKFKICMYSLNSEFLDFWIPLILKDQPVMKKVWKVGHEKPLLKELIFSKKVNKIRSILEFVHSCFEENWDAILTEREITINENQNDDKNIERNKNEFFFKNLYKLLILVETKFNFDEINLFRKTIANELEFFIYELEGDYFMKCFKKVIEIYKNDQEILLIILNLIIDSIVNIENLNNFQEILEFFYKNDRKQIQKFLLHEDVIQKLNFTLGSKIFNSKNEIYVYKLEYLTKLYENYSLFSKLSYIIFIPGNNLFEIFNEMQNELFSSFTNFIKNTFLRNEETAENDHRLKLYSKFCEFLNNCSFRYEAKPLLRLETFLNDIFTGNEEFLRKGMRNILFYNDGNIHRLDSFLHTADCLENFIEVINILKKYQNSDEEFENVFKSWEVLSFIIFKMSDDLYPEVENLVEHLFKADKTELIDLIYPNRYSSKDNKHKLKRLLTKFFNNNYKNVQTCISKMNL